MKYLSLYKVPPMQRGIRFLTNLFEVISRKCVSKGIIPNDIAKILRWAKVR